MTPDPKEPRGFNGTHGLPGTPEYNDTHGLPGPPGYIGTQGLQGSPGSSSAQGPSGHPGPPGSGNLTLCSDVIGSNPALGKSPTPVLGRTSIKLNQMYCRQV